MCVVIIKRKTPDSVAETGKSSLAVFVGPGEDVTQPCFHHHDNAVTGTYVTIDGNWYNNVVVNSQLMYS